MRFIKPLDETVLTDVWRRHREVFTLEENTVVGGFGAGVLEWAAAQDEVSPPRVTCVGIPDAFQEHATRAELMAGMGLDAASLAERVALRLGEARAGGSSAGSAS
jgi:1-deoxy-D-xylulose-5-phosphate synthase